MSVMGIYQKGEMNMENSQNSNKKSPRHWQMSEAQVQVIRKTFMYLDYSKMTQVATNKWGYQNEHL